MSTNPFSDDKVVEPRRVESSVKGLNDQVLLEILDEFGRLENARGRSLRVGDALLILSRQAGYGKSHLIGRIFSALKTRAVLVYVRPFHTEDSYWASLLLKILQELEFPESGEAEYCRPGEFTQLQTFAFAVLSQLVANLIADGEVPHKTPDEAIRFVTAHPAKALGGNDQAAGWAAWLRRHFDSLLPKLDAHLRSLGPLKGGTRPWLKVLFHASLERDEGKRAIAKSWLGAEAIDLEQGREIGLTQNELPDRDSIADRNDAALDRILDICHLAAHYKPVCFFFDQTELYGNRPALSRAFGSVIAELADRAPNQLTVVTANLHPWSATIKPFWEGAHLDRLRAPALQLDSLSEAQATELAERRIAEWHPSRRASADVVGRLVQGAFQRGQPLGVREFLRHCSHEWSQPSSATLDHASTSATHGHATSDSLSAAFQAALRELEAQPKRCLFDPDVFLWATGELAAGLPGVVVRTPVVPADPRGYHRVAWEQGADRVNIGVIADTHWRRWKAVVDSSKSRALGHQGGRYKSLFLRTPELNTLPGRWAIAGEITAAKREHLDVFVVPKDLIIRVYAAHKLFADAVEGDLQVDREALLAFLREQLTPFWAAILRPIGESGEATPPAGPSEVPEVLAQAVVAAVREHLFLSVDDLVRRLGGRVTREQVFVAVGQEGRIRVHAGPSTTVLRWQL